MIKIKEQNNGEMKVLKYLLNNFIKKNLIKK